jgi:Mn2+/Fe2+ NRAMP family transporter
MVAMRVDVWTGMLSGVIAMFAIMRTAAVTLGARGSVNIGTAEQAARALEPLAGSLARVLFPVGSSASVCWRRRCSLDRPRARLPKRSTGKRV